MSCPPGGHPSGHFAAIFQTLTVVSNSYLYPKMFHCWVLENQVDSNERDSRARGWDNVHN